AGAAPARVESALVAAGGILASVESPKAAQTASGPTATLPNDAPRGGGVTGTRFVTLPNSGSTRDTSPSTPWATQTASCPPARPVGVRPFSEKVAGVSRRFRGSILVSVRSWRFPTQI